MSVCWGLPHWSVSPLDSLLVPDLQWPAGTLDPPPTRNLGSMSFIQLNQIRPEDVEWSLRWIHNNGVHYQILKGQDVGCVGLRDPLVTLEMHELVLTEAGPRCMLCSQRNGCWSQRSGQAVHQQELEVIWVAMTACCELGALSSGVPSPSRDNLEGVIEGRPPTGCSQPGSSSSGRCHAFNPSHTGPLGSADE